MVSDSNLRVTDTLADVLALKRAPATPPWLSPRTAPAPAVCWAWSPAVITGSAAWTPRQVADFHDAGGEDHLRTGGHQPESANDIIWDHKLNALPMSPRTALVSFVFRKDYDSHKGNPLELLDSQKRYVVGAASTPVTMKSGSPHWWRPAWMCW